MLFIALTKSDKHGGYCVAGFDENGNNVRLVSTEKAKHSAMSAFLLLFQLCLKLRRSINRLNINLKLFIKQNNQRISA
jgi:hypothetical protein